MTAHADMLRKSLPIKDFASFGVDLVAYVKPVALKGVTSYVVHAADGTPLTMVPDRDTAFAVVRRHEMSAVSVH